MDKSDKKNPLRSHFLDEVTDQITCSTIHPSIRRELEDHITDRVEAYIAEGCTPEEAEEKAVRAMGDPISIGIELNEIHSIQRAPWLTAMTLCLMALGLAAAMYLNGSPEQSANGFLYYIPGLAVLAVTTLKGYPLLAKHSRAVLAGIGILYTLQLGLSVLLAKGILHPLFFRFSSPLFPSPVIGYFAHLALAPVLTLLLYRFRRHGAKALAAAWLLCGAVMLLLGSYDHWFYLSAHMILLLTLAVTTFMLILRGLFPGRKRRLLLVTLAGFLACAGLLHTSPYARRMMGEFLRPDAHISSSWDDTYNSALIRELLSRTPVTHGLELSPEELMDYGTSAWYFSGEELEPSRKPPYIHYDASTVTLWDILPQHYHNNYLIAVGIFLFGWAGGLFILAAVASFYLLLFGCIQRIHGRLAWALAFCCGLLLLLQGIFYVLGNFGFQYASFPNLPLVSEGRISILCNMALLGFICSAYRYDRVIEEPQPPLRREPAA